MKVVKNGTSGGGDTNKAQKKQRKMGMSAEAWGNDPNSQSFQGPLYPKTPEERKIINEAVQGNVLFLNLDEEQRFEIYDHMSEVSVEPGDLIMAQGDEGNNFYVIKSGQCDVYVAEDAHLKMEDELDEVLDRLEVVKGALSANLADDRKAELRAELDTLRGREAELKKGLAGSKAKKVRTMKDGESFGELALLYNCPRTATVKAKSKCVLWEVDRLSFRAVMQHTIERKRAAFEAFLDEVPLTKPLSKYQKNIVADALEIVKLTDGEEIVKEGRDDGGYFYIIKDGVAKVYVGDKFIRELGSREYLGEVAILENKAPTATVVAKGDVTVCRLDRENFMRLLGPLSRKFEEHSKQYKFYDEGAEVIKADVEVKRPVTSSSAVETEQNQRGGSLVAQDKLSAAMAGKQLSLDSFDKLTQLGGGTYGRVWLCKYKETNDLCALKIMSKSLILKRKQVEHVFSEIDVMKKMSHPFVASCYGSFQDDANLYIVMEYLGGRDLFYHLKTRTEEGYTLTNGVARTYAAEVLLALEYLHSQGIVYRDLKPENLMLAGDGNLKVVDFGFAKTIGKSGQALTMCGTPQYSAPEIFYHQGYGVGVDYWALGCLIYEMLCGYPPFDDNNFLKIIEQILMYAHNKRTLQFPSWVNKDAKDLIVRLLTADLGKRAGCGMFGALEIRDHPWFDGFNWDDVKHRRVSGPLKSNVHPLSLDEALERQRQSTDSEYDDEYDEDAQEDLTKDDQALFDGF